MLESVRQKWRRPRPLWQRIIRRWAHPDAIPLLPEYSTDDLSQLWMEQTQLLLNGEIVWLSVLGAHPQLYYPEEGHLPALVACDVDASFDDRVEELDAITTELNRRAVHGPSASDPIIKAIKDDYGRYSRLPLPLEVTGGPRVFLFSLLIYRPHLPTGILRGAHFPGLYHSECSQIMALPSHAWPQDLIDRWISPSD